MDDIGLMRHQLWMEESRAERLDHELAEAAAIGRFLLSKNEELQQEVEYWKGDGCDGYGDGPDLQRRDSEMAGFRHQLKRFSSQCLGDLDAWGGLDNEELDHRVPRRLSKAGSKECSTVDLAREYETDLQELLAENRRLNGKALSLDRENRTLQERIDDISHEQDLNDASTAASWKPDRRDTVKSADSRSILDFADLENREDKLKSELDEERNRVLDLEEDLKAAKQTSSHLSEQVMILQGECQDHLAICENREAEVECLHQRLEELAHAVQVQRVMGSSNSYGAAGHSPPSRFDGGFHSLERDILCSRDSDARGSRADVNMLRQVDELREQLAAAEAAARDARALRTELSLQKREADALREQLHATHLKSGRPMAPVGGAEAIQLAASASASKAVAHEALMELEEVRREAERLRKKLTAAEAGEREAKEAAQRQRELARRARQAAKREAEELRQELVNVEAKALRCEAVDAQTSQKELLTKVERLKVALQAETKARRYIEAELLRTLGSIRHMDLELRSS